MLIVGLGNIGLKYKNTYHNCGFMVVDKLAKKLNIKFKASECKAKTALLYNNGEKIVIAKPTTLMNLSGEAVRELLGKYHMTHDDIVVIYDDIDINIGTLRLRKVGSAGTHNGMRNIIDCIGAGNFKRIRVGIGADRGQVPLMNYVLSKVQGENKKLLETASDNAADALLDLIDGKDFEKVMQTYNK